MRFETALDVLATPNRETVARAGDLVAAIGSPSDCRAAAPEGELGTEADRQLRRAIVEVDTLRLSGRVRQARDRADEVLFPAGRPSSRSLMAEALLARGLARAAAGARGSGVEDLQAAYWMAVARHQDSLAAEASRSVVLHVVTGPSAWEEAERWSKLAEAAERRIGIDAPSWELLSARATAAYRADRFEPARRDYQTAVLAARDAAPSQRVSLLNDFTELLIAEHRVDDALASAREAAALAKQHLPNDSPEHAATLRNLGVALEQTGEREHGLEALQASLAMARRIFDPSSPEVTRTLDTRGRVLTAAGRLDEALTIAQEVLDLTSAREPADSANVAEALTSKGVILRELGRLDEARVTLERAAAAHERGEGRRTLDHAFTLMHLGNVRLEFDDFEGTVDAQTRALEILGEVVSPGSPRIAGALASRATALLLLQRPEEASLDLDAATGILGRAGEERSILGSMVLAMQAEAQAQLGHAEVATELALEALALERELDPEPGPELVRAHSTAADTLFLAGALDEAERVVREGLAILDHLDPMDHLRGKLALDLARIALVRGDLSDTTRRCTQAVDTVEDATVRAEISTWCERNTG